METVIVALIVSLVAPVMLSWLTNRQRSLEKLQDWARQDKVAAVAAATAEAAALKATEAAKLLLASNERVAVTAVVTNKKLDVIHVLVNSNMTAAMQDQLDALHLGLIQMQEIIALKKLQGVESTQEVQVTLETLRAKITELETQLADRRKQSVTVDEMQRN